MDAEMRELEPGDLPAITNVWREVGWIDDSDEQAAGLQVFLGVGASLVGEVDGAAECLVHRTPGVIRYDDLDLSLCAITAVTTGAVARGLGLASRLMRGALAAGAREGAAVAALGMFEQGFYDRFGFGSLPYTSELSFDPARLRVPLPRRRPVRVGRDDWAEVGALLARRARSHGGVVLHPPETLQAELAWVDDPYLGLGFRGDDGRLTACVIGSSSDEHGPFKVEVLAYETGDDLLELLGLLRSLAAQLHEVVLVEPAGVQLQDVLDQPVRHYEAVPTGRRPQHAALAVYQVRLLDLGRCVAARRWPGDPVRFDLVLSDPLSDHPDGWPGLAGDHTITVGDPSSVAPGHRGDLPVLRASIGAFSRLWFGVRPATGLALTDDLSGPPELLAALDRALLLPRPEPGLSF